ncbi:MAG: hypothetical protein IRZ07_05730 [Microbispora sp.]|nr:hypothetical protein [Microbispora sp.]
MFLAVWLARSARELTAADGTPAPRGPLHPRGPSRPLTLAVVLLSFLVLVGSEQTARLSYSGWEDECDEWTLLLRRFGDTRPEDRGKAFLCHARSTVDGVPPMFPDTLPDQYVLAYGRLLCTADGKELVFLCPDVVARDEPELLRSESEERADIARYVAEENARCRDPWPRLRARRQGTAAYFLFEGGGYGVYDPEDDTSGEGEDVFDAAIDDGFVAAGGSTVAVMTYGENEPMCLTV